jgi:hypothetical protein
MYKTRIEEPRLDVHGSIELRNGSRTSGHLASVLVIGAELILALLTVPPDDSSEDFLLQTPVILLNPHGSTTSATIMSP